MKNKNSRKEKSGASFAVTLPAAVAAPAHLAPKNAADVASKRTIEAASSIEQRARLLADRQKWEQAARLLTRAARQEPQDVTRWLQIARWQRQNREPQAAVKTLREALRFNHADESRGASSRDVESRDAEITTEDAKKARGASASGAGSRSGAKRQRAAGALAGNAKVFVQDGTGPNVSDAPKSTSLWQALAEAQLEAQNWNGCIEACREVLESEPRHHFGREMMATAFLHSGRIDEAEKVMRELLLLSPRDPLHRLKFATLLQLQGKSGASSREFQRVADSHPNAPFVDEAHDAIETLDHIQIQQVLMRAGEDSEFAEQLESAFEAALPENGFHLSESGRESLRHILGDGRPDYGSQAPPRIH